MDLRKKLKHIAMPARTALGLFLDYCRGYSDVDMGKYAQPDFLADTSSVERPMRLNVIVPTIEQSQIYGGIATALRFFDAMREGMGCEARIILLHEITREMKGQYPEYAFGDCSDGSKVQVVSIHGKKGASVELSVRADDYFICTWWITLYRMYPVMDFQRQAFGCANKMVYLIQDYEPGFYPWSTEYLLCESTYRHKDIIAVVNSGELAHFLSDKGYEFDTALCLEPTLNASLRANLIKDLHMRKEKVCLVYGRPRVSRNCFGLILGGLRLALAKCPELGEWEFVSIGHKHRPVPISPNKKLTSVGKLSLEAYADMLRKTSVGVSLMCSPHPSYPPLEMASFGAVTITNSFETKNLTNFSDNIRSLDVLTFEAVADAIIAACAEYREAVDVGIDNAYVFDDGAIEAVVAGVCEAMGV